MKLSLPTNDLNICYQLYLGNSLADYVGSQCSAVYSLVNDPSTKRPCSLSVIHKSEPTIIEAGQCISSIYYNTGSDITIPLETNIKDVFLHTLPSMLNQFAKPYNKNNTQRIIGPIIICSTNFNLKQLPKIFLTTPVIIHPKLSSGTAYVASFITPFNKFNKANILMIKDYVYKL